MKRTSSNLELKLPRMRKLVKEDDLLAPILLLTDMAAAKASHERRSTQPLLLPQLLKASY